MRNKTKEELAKDFEIERYEIATGMVHPDKEPKPEVKEVAKEEETPKKGIFGSTKKGK